MRSEKGSITIYVLIAMLTFTALLMAIYVRSSNVEARQIEIIEKIKSIYENYDISEAYATVTGAKPQILGYEKEVKKIKIKALKENGLSVDQNGKEIVYYAGTSENTAPTETTKKDFEFGRWQKSNDIVFSDISSDQTIYIWIKNEDGIVSDSVLVEINSEEYNTKYLITAGEYAGDSNRKYVSGGKTAYIPAGFVVSYEDEENTINGGLVIYSNKANGVTKTAEEYIAEIKKGTSGYTLEGLRGTYNQYVWIPVENPSDIYGTITEADVTKNPNQGLVVGEQYGKSYDFGNSTNGFATTATDSKITALNWPSKPRYSNINSREPAYLVADNREANKNANGNKIITEAGIKNEFSRMIASVETYGGFYIGRYELTGTKDTPTLKKGVSPLTNITWYELYTSCQKLEQNNNKVKAHTTMIWGCQWDQAIKKSLIETTNAQTGVSDFLTNAGAYGVYNSSKTTSGSKAAAYNIYDMGGNVDDWTLEAGNYNGRVKRGGPYSTSASYSPASFRSDYFPSNSNVSYVSIGCRPQLYL